jgi:hypothetical protein
MPTCCTHDPVKSTKGTIGILSLVVLIWLLFCPQRCCSRCAPVVSTPVVPTVDLPVPAAVPEIPVPPAIPEIPAPAIAVIIPQVPPPAIPPVAERHPGVLKTAEVFGGTATVFGLLPAAEVAPDRAFDRNSTTDIEDGLADRTSGTGTAVTVTFVHRPGHTKAIIAYAITSSERGETQLDPTAWRLIGVLPDGTERELDHRDGEVFTGRTQRRVFAVADVPACSAYRLEFTAAAGAGALVRLAEVEFVSPR